MPKFAVIIVAAGRSRRFGDPNFKKPFVKLNQKPVFLHSVEKFQKRRDVAQTIIVVAPDDKEDFLGRFGANVAVMGLDLATGGDQRSDSVRNALQVLREDIEFVAVHDAARPCVLEDDIDAVFNAAIRHRAAILACPVNSTLKRVTSDHQVQETVDRERLWQAQTPQVFQRELLCRAYAETSAQSLTDDASVVESIGEPVFVVPGSPLNIKITRREDLRLAAACLQAAPPQKFDAPLHPFADDRMFR